MNVKELIEKIQRLDPCKYDSVGMKWMILKIILEDNPIMYESYEDKKAELMKAMYTKKKSVTPEKAIEILKAEDISEYSYDEIISARDMAIRALEGRSYDSKRS